MGDRENQRIEIFDADGKFLKQWTGIGYPYGLFITPDQHVWMIDGGYDRILELDQNGKVLGALGEPGHAPGQFAWGHFMAVSKDGKIYAADVLNWRFQVFEQTATAGKMATYVPTKRMFLGPYSKLRLVDAHQRAQELSSQSPTHRTTAAERCSRSHLHIDAVHAKAHPVSLNLRGDLMKTRSIAVLFVCLFALNVSFAQNLNLGIWKLNEAKSKIPAGVGKNTTVTYYSQGSDFKVMTDGVNAQSQPTHTEWTGKFDAKPYPVTGSPDETYRAYKVKNEHLLLVANMKGDKTVSNGKIQVSKDGKSRTLEMTYFGSKKIHAKYVYDKQ